MYQLDKIFFSPKRDVHSAKILDLLSMHSAMGGNGNERTKIRERYVQRLSHLPGAETTPYWL